MKIFILFHLLATLLFSSQVDVETKIYSLIIHSIFPQKSEIKVWTDDKNKIKFLNAIESVELVSTPDKADFIILHSPLESKQKALVFTSTYRALKYYKESAIGGFYWQKGRPNILFLKNNLEKYNLTLPSSMQKYVEISL